MNVIHTFSDTTSESDDQLPLDGTGEIRKPTISTTIPSLQIKADRKKSLLEQVADCDNSRGDKCNNNVPAITPPDVSELSKTNLSSVQICILPQENIQQYNSGTQDQSLSNDYG